MNQHFLLITTIKAKKKLWLSIFQRLQYCNHLAGAASFFHRQLIDIIQFAYKSLLVDFAIFKNKSI
jgi:hypothetical protein